MLLNNSSIFQHKWYADKENEPLSSAPFYFITVAMVIAEILYMYAMWYVKGNFFFHSFTKFSIAYAADVDGERKRKVFN